MNPQSSYTNTVSFKTLHVVGKFFIAIFIVVLFEGAIRKWVWDSATLPLLFLRDLFVIVAVLWGALHRYFNFRSWPELFLTFWSALIILWTFIQVIMDLQPTIVGLIGIRSWVLYLWFVLLCVRALNWQDLEYIFKCLALTILFMVPLALVQFMSPPTSFINKQPGAEDQYIFQVIKDIVRSSGTFSFTLGYTLYLSLMLPIILFLISGGLKDSIKPTIKVLIIGLFFIGVLISGSRGSIISTMAIIGFWLIAMLLANKLPKPSPIKILFGFIGLISLIILFAPILERSLDANLQRFENASTSEDVGQRIEDMFTGSKETWNQFQVLGYGIGAGANASRGFMPETTNGFLLGENEVDRILNEGGGIGIFLIILKWSVILIGLLSAWRIFRNNNEPLPLSIWLVLALQLPTAPVIGQISAHAIILLLLSLGFLSLSSWQKEKLRRYSC